MNKLKDIIEKGILIDLMKAERALSVFNVIAKHSPQINIQTKEFITTYAYFQALAFNEFILATSRIFDKYSKRNNTRCIDAVIHFLRNNSNNLPAIDNKYQLKLNLIEFSVPDYFFEPLDSNDDLLYADRMAMYYEIELINFRNDLKSIREWRDKHLAHNERFKKTSIRVNETEPFLTFGWQFVIIMGWSYFGTIYGDQNNIPLRRDARSYSYEIEKSIRKYFDKTVPNTK